MMLFALASLAPLGLFGLGVWLGGLWLLAGLGYMTVLAALLDQISGLYLGDAPEGAGHPAPVRTPNFHISPCSNNSLWANQGPREPRRSCDPVDQNKPRPVTKHRE